MKKFFLLILSIIIISSLSFFFSNKTYIRKGLNNIDLSRTNKLMIVAHPDDETIWGGSHLLTDDYLVVCVTCGRNKIRNQEIEAALEISDDQVIMLGYPDKKFGKRSNWDGHKKQIRKDLNQIINAKEFEQIVTHNPKGEYGHIHHQIISEITLDVVKQNKLENKFYYFGNYYSKNKKIKEQPIDNLKLKMKMINVYESQKFIKDSFGQMFKYEKFIPYKDWR